MLPSNVPTSAYVKPNKYNKTPGGASEIVAAASAINGVNGTISKFVFDSGSSSASSSSLFSSGSADLGRKRSRLGEFSNKVAYVYDGN